MTWDDEENFKSYGAWSYLRSARLDLNFTEARYPEPGSFAAVMPIQIVGGQYSVQQMGATSWKIDPTSRHQLTGSLNLGEFCQFRCTHTANDHVSLSIRPECLFIGEILLDDGGLNESDRWSIKKSIRRNLLLRSFRDNLPKDDGVWVLCRSELWKKEGQ